MAWSVDFEDIKRQHSMLEVAQMLNIKLNKEPTTYRGECPRHPSREDDEEKHRRLVITPQKGDHGAFHCSRCPDPKKGGYDCIALAAHVLGCNQQKAAETIARHFGTGTSTGKSTSTSRSPTVPESEAKSDSTKKAKLLALAEKLDPEHILVDTIGFDTDLAKKAGIGYYGDRGILAGTVAVPVYDKDTKELLGYIGITEAKLPSDFTPNVVAFPKTA